MAFEMPHSTRKLSDASVTLRISEPFRRPRAHATSRSQDPGVRGGAYRRKAHRRGVQGELFLYMTEHHVLTTWHCHLQCASRQSCISFSLVNDLIADSAEKVESSLSSRPRECRDLLPYADRTLRTMEIPCITCDVVRVDRVVTQFIFLVCDAWYMVDV